MTDIDSTKITNYVIDDGKEYPRVYSECKDSNIQYDDIFTDLKKVIIKRKNTFLYFELDTFYNTHNDRPFSIMHVDDELLLYRGKYLFGTSPGPLRRTDCSINTKITSNGIDYYRIRSSNNDKVYINSNTIYLTDQQDNAIYGPYTLDSNGRVEYCIDGKIYEIVVIDIVS